MTAILEMAGTTCQFGSIAAVLDVHLKLGAGVHGLLGPNGAGKTTFLRVAAGLIAPTHGKVVWLGDHRRGDRALDNAIAACIDGEGLPSDQTPLSLVTFLLQCAGLPLDDAAQRARENLEDLGLQQQLDRKIGVLSRGQRQRVKLAQAFALPSRLLLLDEPLNALDPVWRRHVTAKIAAAGAAGTCVLLSSHVLAEVEEVAARMILLFKGRVVAAGTREEIHQLVHNRGMGLEIRCDEPRQLAAALMQEPTTGALRVEDGVVVVETDDMAALCRSLPAAVLRSGVRVEEVRPGGDDLVGMFTALSGQVR